MEPADAIKLSLLENGLDFIRSGLKCITANESKFDLKYAVLHISAGIELVLKDRLMREDWRLVFADETQADENKLRSGNFQSVSLWECLKRLDHHCPVSAPAKKPLEKFKNLRNRIEHFAMNHSQAALEASVAVVLSQLLDFIIEAYEENDLTAEESELMQEIRAKLGEFHIFATTRLALIQPVLDEHKGEHGFGKVVECPSCLQETLMADCDVLCAFCGYVASDTEAAELHIANTYGTPYFDPKEDDLEYLHRCPNCENIALVYEPGYTETNGICFSCGNKPAPGSLEPCDQCHEMTVPDDIHGGMCPDCLGQWISADHR